MVIFALASKCEIPCHFDIGDIQTYVQALISFGRLHDA